MLKVENLKQKFFEGVANLALMNFVSKFRAEDYLEIIKN